MKSALGNYARPRDRITSLLQQGVIVRVKKGLYVFGPEYGKRAYSRELLANLIYGPSYISLEYALHYHGLIPERVEVITSVALGRSRKFLTPVGNFTYRNIPLRAFRIGADRVEIDGGRSFLMAVPEKALADKLRLDRASIRSEKQLKSWLFENLRIDPVTIEGMQSERLMDYAVRYESHAILVLSKLVRHLATERGAKPGA